MEQRVPESTENDAEAEVSEDNQAVGSSGLLIQEIDRDFQRVARDLAETQAQLANLRRRHHEPSAELVCDVPQLPPHTIKGTVAQCKSDARQLLRSFKRVGGAVKRRLVREISKRMSPGLHPLLICRSVSTDGRIVTQVLLPSTSSVRQSIALRGAAASYEYSFRSSVANLSELVLYLASASGSEESSVVITLLRGKVAVREVVVSGLRVHQLAPAVARFEPFADSLGVVYRVRISSPKSSSDASILVGVHATPRLLSLPWEMKRELGFVRQTPEMAANFIPCFRAEVNLSDYQASVSWPGAPEGLEYLPLYADRTVEFAFDAPQKEVLSMIQVTFGTYRRVNHIPVELELESKGLLWRGRFSASELIDNSPYALPLPRAVLAKVKGARVTIRLSAPEALADSQVAVLGNALPSNSSLDNEQRSAMLVREEVVARPYSQLNVVPTFRRALLNYPTQRPLKISIVLSETFCPWWVRRFARAFTKRFSELGHQAEVILSVRSPDTRDAIRASDILIVSAQDYSNQLREVITDVRASYGVVVAFQPATSTLAHVRLEGYADPLPMSEFSEMFAACSVVMAIGDDQAARLERKNSLPVVSLRPEATQQDVSHWLQAVLDLHKRTYLPKVSIVTVLYRKEREIPFFLSALSEQDYEGDLELIVVDDCSPDQSSAALESSYELLRRQGARLPILKLIRNDSNLGNCGSRNRALKEAKGDVVVIVDCDCLLNRSFLSAHVYSHLFHGAAVVTGPCNLETGAEEPLDALDGFDRDRARVKREALLQDSINLDSFVNCITRNFSIQRRFITEELFDEHFGYSAHPDSGFGWEDVEMGYRLFKRGLRIHFTNDAFSVHISHLSTTDDRVKPLKSLKNFRRLLEKHPAIKNDARRWYQETLTRIEEWSTAHGHDVTDDQLSIRETLGRMYPYPFAIGRARSLRVLTYRWHVPHQYELYKLPHEFVLVSNLGTGFTREWEFEQRPQPKNARFLPIEKVRVQDYDLAVLHFDENVLSYENCNEVIGADWGLNFKYFVERISGIPKVAICHGTPQFVGQYRPEYHESDLGDVIEGSRKLLVDYLGDITVVCNSHQAAREWGFNRSRVIWHGFDPSEFTATDYSGGILSLGRSMKERPHYRGYEHFKRVREFLPEEFRPKHHTVFRPSIYSAPQEIYSRLRFEMYRQSLRDHSVYFNPTLRSPMPRSRGEAMMSGLVSVSAANHDVQLFIKNGWNGFYSDSSEEMADYLLFLMQNKKACREIGLRSRATAADVFNHDRYLHAWQTLIHELIGGSQCAV